jgi:hypothetical protein
MRTAANLLSCDHPEPIKSRVTPVPLALLMWVPVGRGTALPQTETTWAVALPNIQNFGRVPKDTAAPLTENDRLQSASYS